MSQIKITKRKRNKVISFRLTENEKSNLDKKIKKTGLKNQDFFMKLINEKEIFVIEEFAQLILELKRIGVNLNQLSKKLNSEEKIGMFKKKDLNKSINQNSENLESLLLELLNKIK